MIDCNNHHPTFRVHVRRRLAQTSALLAAMSVSACHKHHVHADRIGPFSVKPLCVHRGVDSFYAVSTSTSTIFDISSVVNQGNASNVCDDDPDAPHLVADINASFTANKLTWQVDCTKPGYLTQIPVEDSADIQGDSYYAFQITNGGKTNDYVVYFPIPNSNNMYAKEVLFYGNTD